MTCSTTAMPIAKKEHRCDLCGEAIPVGVKYLRFSGIADGSPFDIKLHSECSEVVDDYALDTGEAEWSSDEIHWWIEERLCSKCEERDGCGASSTLECYLSKTP